MSKRFFQSIRCCIKRNRDNKSGQITIFLCIVLPGIIFLFGMLVDIVIISSGISQAKRSTILALDSVLANYSTVLKDEFKIFCINENNDNEIEEKVKDILLKNFNDKSITKIYLNEIEVSMLDSLDNPEVLKKQIIGYMKYNLPVDIIEGAYGNIQPFLDNTNSFIALDKKLETDNLLSNIDYLCETLNKYLFSGEKLYPINKFNDNEYLENMIDKYYNNESKVTEYTKIHNYLKGYINSSHLSINLLGQIERQMVVVENKLDELKDYALEKLSDKSVLASELADVIMSDITWYLENLIKEKTQNEINKLRKNIITLEKMIEELDENISDKLLGFINDYEYIDFSINFKKEGEKGDDLRKYAKNLFLKLLDNTHEDISIPYSYVLPSNSIKKENFFTEISNSLNNGFSLSKSEEAQNIFKSIAQNNFLKGLENLYINEYIVRYLSNMQKGGQVQRKSFFKSEVEYVIFGNLSSNANYNSAKASILAVRFGMNTLSAYLDAKKRTIAYGTATAIAGWWSFGLGVPIVSNLIMCGWGLGEGVLDVKDLVSGKKVPLYKMPGEWKLDIGAGKILDDSTSLIKIGYEDYLRLFLLTVPMNNKLARIADIIQLGSDGVEEFKISKCYSVMEVKVIVSIQCKLIGKLFFKDGKYSYSYTTRRGYE